MSAARSLSWSDHFRGQIISVIRPVPWTTVPVVRSFPWWINSKLWDTAMGFGFSTGISPPPVLSVLLLWIVVPHRPPPAARVGIQNPKPKISSSILEYCLISEEKFNGPLHKWERRWALSATFDSYNFSMPWAHSKMKINGLFTF